MTVGVIYLARAAEGLPQFERFIESHRRHPAGCDFDLIVIYKGFEQQSELRKARAVFADLPHIALELDDFGFDIGAYLAASRRLDHDYLCFLNTYAELAAEGWLASLMAHAQREGVGITGATGSYESLFDTILLERKARWAWDRWITDNERRAINFYFDFLFAEPRKGGVVPRTGFARLPTAVRNIVRAPWYHWQTLSRIWPGQQMADIRRFPRFPNPHIRSNGFLIRRERLLQFDRSTIRSKSDAMIFESGLGGLTARLRRAGLAAIVVGRDGSGYDVATWPQSRTYRSGCQDNLLLFDNHTRLFVALSAGGKATHTRITWGDYAGPAPPGFPHLGIAFARGSLSA